MNPTELESAIDALYKLPDGEFVAQRNRLAARLRGADAREAAVRVGKLGRPRVTAWTVNQLFWRSRKTFDRLIDAGQDVRRCHEEAGDADALRRAVEVRRKTSAQLLRRAETLLQDVGRKPSPTLMRRVELTLDAVATLGNAGPEQTLGRMTDDLDPPGFEALFASASAIPPRKPSAGKARSPSAAQRKARQAEEARRALREAEQELERRKGEAESARAGRDLAAGHVAVAQENEALAREALARARTRVRKTSAQLTEARTAVRRTAAAVGRAEKKVTTARRRVAAGKKKR